MSTHSGQELSHYRLVDKIGEGGMGVVWKAQDTVLDRPVAIKILPAEVSRDPTRRELFFKEARLASQVSNAHIVQVYEFGSEDDLDFIVMEYVEGKPLGRLIQGRPLPAENVAEFGLQIASALSLAHRKGLIHRDLKPANVLVTTDGEVKVVDFGLAMLFDSTHTASTAGYAALPALGDERTVAGDEATALGIDESSHADSQRASGRGVLAGTLPYMSPEQARCEELDARSDIFSLGVILYEMASGQRPFRSRKAKELLEQITRGHYIPPQELVDDLPAELERIIRKSLARRREERYQTMDDLAVDLKRLGRELEVGSSVSYVHLTHELASQRRRSRVGVSLVAAVALLAVSLAAWQFWFGRPPELASIAVLPFDNRSGDADAEYLNDGITESVINNLSEFPNLQVMAGSTVFRYKGSDEDPREIGRKLGVAVVLIGHVQMQGELLVVGAELVDVGTGSQLWGKRYERQFSDVMVLQREISRAITEKLRGELSGEDEVLLAKRDPANPEAYRLYIRGRHHWNKRTRDDLLRARDLFQQALELDPEYALAYAGIADAYSRLANNAMLPADEVMPRAEAAARRALELDETLPEAHVALATVLRDFQWDWAGAELEMQRAITLNPRHADTHHAYAFLLATTGRMEEAITAILRARELDPLSPPINANVAGIYCFARRYDEAVAAIQTAIELDAGSPAPRAYLGTIYIAQGRYAEAETELKATLDAMGASLIRGAWIHALGRDGRTDEAWTHLDALLESSRTEYVSPVALAMALVGVGEHDRAFGQLEEGLDRRTSDMFIAAISPLFDPLRDDPRYGDLRRRMNLTEH